MMFSEYVAKVVKLPKAKTTITKTLKKANVINSVVSLEVESLVQKHPNCLLLVSTKT